MMPLLWVELWSMLPLSLAVLSGPDRCTDVSSSSHDKSPLLKSLRCYNDYQSYVHCEWREPRDAALQLWFKTDKDRELCVPHGAAVQDAGELRTVQCRYRTALFAIAIKHTVFFLENGTLALCSAVPHEPLELRQHLRARPPVNLSAGDEGDGGRRLSWSSPYPSSSSLNDNLTYQISYRTDTQDAWTTEDVTNTSVKLERRSLRPGRRYEARVRVRARVGRWSHWSPAVTWQTAADAGQPPSLHCVLDGEKEVKCSWEVSRELAHFITYQLACRHNQTAPSERCCANPTVRPDPGGTLLRFSCSLTVADPAHLQLELRPARSGKVFKAKQHIRPNPPQQVKVTEKNRNWVVTWTKPITTSPFGLYYQVSYCSTHDQGPPVLQNISQGPMFLNIPGDSLTPSQRYQVKVRSLVVPGEGSLYEGIPSEWTDPVDWTSCEASWSRTTMIYISISVFVAIVTLTLYCTIPACQRRVILWVDSVPSPGKSKTLSEIKSATSWTVVQGETTSMCKVQHSDSVSTCSSDVSLWPTKDGEKGHLEQDQAGWKGDNLPSHAEKANGSDTSSMSFNGPYIFSQSSDASSKSADVKSEEEETEKETLSADSSSPSPVKFGLSREDYVCLPSHSISRSTQDLVSHSDAGTNTHSAEEDQERPDKTDVQTGVTTSSPQPPAYTSGPFTPWPQGGTVQASGYCHLPTDHMRAEK